MSNITTAQTIPSATPYDTELVARATALVPLIREHAVASIAARAVVPEAFNAIEDAGLLRLWVPERYGGHGATLRTGLEVLAEIARGDGSTAWASTLLNVCTWFATTYSLEAQDEVFGENPNAHVSGIFTPGSKAEKVPGGYLISGEWPYSSGSFRADWATLGIALDVPEGQDPRGLALVPQEAWTIRPTWFVSGMQGSGSDTIVVEDHFVPDHRVQSFGEMCEARYATPFQAEERNANMGFIAVAALVLIFPQLGLADHALELTREKLPHKRVLYTQYTEARNSPTHQLGVAEAATDFHVARLLAAASADEIDRAAEARTTPDIERRTQIRNDTGVVAELVNRGLHRLLTANGAGSFADGNVLGQIWRDSEIAARHGVVSPQVVKEAYGRVLLGTENPFTIDI